MEGFLLQDGRWLNLLGNGNIVNIACADGHPAEIMDTSFALQALSAQHLVQQGKKTRQPLLSRDLKGSIREWHKSGSSPFPGSPLTPFTEDQQQYLSGWDA
ncbi:MAG: hypothetical protein Ct9H90mP9_1490 [Pseudomonadota bacterium]|nr:MAG: hypothetical protein Ct9H90mP9_1490 [Pseudomonadota bacterium]